MTNDRPELQDRFPRTVERGLRRFACGGVTGRITIIDSIDFSSTAIGPEFSADFYRPAASKPFTLHSRSILDGPWMNTTVRNHKSYPITINTIKKKQWKMRRKKFLNHPNTQIKEIIFAPSGSYWSYLGHWSSRGPAAPSSRSGGRPSLRMPTG